MLDLSPYVKYWLVELSGPDNVTRKVVLATDEGVPSFDSVEKLILKSMDNYFNVDLSDSYYVDSDKLQQRIYIHDNNSYRVTLKCIIDDVLFSGDVLGNNDQEDLPSENLRCIR